MYAVREMGAGAGVFKLPVAFDGEGEYARRGQTPRWPILVREQAIEPPGSSSDLASTPSEDPEPNSTEPDPTDDPYLLGEQCARAYMEADALQYRAMRLLAEFHQRRGWEDTGFQNTAEWLAWRIGIRVGAARERLRTALALDQLPQISESMKNGELSFTKVRALTRAATPENETTLLAFARSGSAANLERVIRGWKLLDRKSELTAEQRRHRSRQFSAYVDDDGMVVVRGRLDPEVGTLLMRAVEAASDALYRREGETEEGGEAGTGPEAGTEQSDGQKTDDGLVETTPEQRRADAVGLIAERALAAGLGGKRDPSQAGSGNDGNLRCEESQSENGQSENGDTKNAAPAPISGSRAERYQVMLHVDSDTLGEAGEPGLSELEDGTRVSAETSRRLSCDGSVVKIVHGPEGQVVGAGRRSRTVAPSLRRALEARDRGCRFPGCGCRFTEAHHVKHWADGGETSLRNLVLLCWKHHRAVHEGGAQVCIDVRGQVVFFTPRGRPLFGAPVARGPRAEAATGTTASLGRHRATGPPEPPPALRPAHLSGASKWKRDRDIPWAVEAEAWEALDSS